MKAIKKRILKISIFFILIFVFAGAIFAFVGNFYVSDSARADIVGDIKTDNAKFQSLDKKIVINDKKNCDITETYVVDFVQNNINVGMTRNVSKVQKITRIVDGKKYVTRTIAKLSDISVKIEKDGQISDEYFFTDEDSSYYYIYTGYDQDYKHGKYTYTIHYTYDMGEDFLNKFDDFTFDILDYGGQSAIPYFSCQITLPKEFVFDKTLDQILSFRTNDMQPTSEDFASSKNFSFKLIDDKTLSCEIFNMDKGQGLTMQLLLPNKYFSTKFTPSVLYIIAFVLCFVSILASLAIVLYSRFGKKVVKTIEFYPPKNYSPIGVARAYRGYVQPKDFASLALDWAAKGYVKIDIKGKRQVTLTKLKDMPMPEENVGDYMTAKKEVKYFNALFKDSQTYDPTQLKTDFALKKEVQTAAQRILNEDAKVRKKKNLFKAILSLLSILPILCYAGWTITQGFGKGFTFMTILFMFIALYIIIYAKIPTSLIWFKLIWGGMFGGIPLYMMLSQNNFSVDIFKLGIISTISMAICLILGAFIVVYSKKDLEQRGKILGFRDFLVKAELDKLKRLLDDDPQYFYNILPYCYSLGITKKMQKRFKELNAPEPDYLGGYDVSTFYMYYSASMIYSSSGNVYNSRGGSFGGGGFGGSAGGGGGGGGFGGR